MRLIWSWRHCLYMNLESQNMLSTNFLLQQHVSCLQIEQAGSRTGSLLLDTSASTLQV